MRVRAAELVTFGGTVEGVRTASRSISTRRGVLLRIATPEGIIGQGEATPLPGFSADSFETVRRALGSVEWDRVPDPEPDASGAALLEALAEALPGVGGAARFAIETALLDVLGQRAGKPIFDLLGDETHVRPDSGGTSRSNVPGEVPLSAFAGGAEEPELRERARSAVESGFQTIKVKIQGPRITAHLDALRDVRDIIGARALRFDANQTFAASTVRAELDALRALDAELVEEPVPTGELLPALADPPVPIALDESLQDPRAWERLAPALERLRCVAVVLKPAALGGFARCLALARDARARGIDVTVSHLFDGPVALAAAGHLALAVASRHRASGLSRHGGLAAWPSVDIPILGESRLVARENPGLGVRPLGAPR